MASTFLRPTSGGTGWGAGWAAVDETTPSDADFMNSSASNGSSFGTTLILSGDTPASISGAALRVRCTAGTFGGVPAATIPSGHKLSISIAGTEISYETLPVGWTTLVFTFTKAEVEAWNLADLRLTVWSTSNTSGRRTLISWIELEILEAATGNFFLFL